MTMQTDVLAISLAASGAATTARARVRGLVVEPGSSTGSVIVKDGGSSGTTLIEVDIPSNSNPNSFYTLVPGEGVLFSTNVYATLTGIASVTVYYG